MNRLKRILSEPYIYLNPKYIVNNVISGRLFLLWRQLSPYIKSDELYLKVYYRLAIGRKLNLNNPKTFTEKIQWLKLHNRDPLYSKMVDKYSVRDIVSAKLGDEFLVPLLGVFDSFDDIEFNKLPASFVLKTTHDSGTVCVCTDKKAFKPENFRAIFTAALKRNYFYLSREYPYKYAVPRIIAEEYLVTDTPELGLVDYKFFCFDGEPKFVMVVGSWANETFNNFFDLNFNPIEFNSGFARKADIDMTKPKNFGKMVEIARKLAGSLVFIRVDMYNIAGKIFFGEYTFHHNGGLSKFSTLQEDIYLGKLIRLNKL